jgi:hypothetical protein
MNLLALTLLFAAAEGETAPRPLADLQFATGTLKGWETQGQGFYVTTADGRGPSLRCGVCSSDRGRGGATGILRVEFVVPGNAAEIRFQAYAVRAKAALTWQGNKNLNVVLADADARKIPKQVRTRKGWKVTKWILPRNRGEARDYRWDVSAHAGRTVQLVLGDADARPGCYLYCSGFRIVPRNKAERRGVSPPERKGRPSRTSGLTPRRSPPSEEVQAFTRDFVRLTRKHQLAPPLRYRSRHFTALSNANDRFTRTRLKNCELIYAMFFDHFRRQGFPLQTPRGKLLVAVFENQAGFWAYFEERLPVGITGMYDPRTNRFVLYDFATNQMFRDSKNRALAVGRGHGGRGQRYLDKVQRLWDEYRSGTNIGTTMHEVAHQLSFNAGLLNRRGDVPAWLAEGLACYCESSDASAWLGIGQPNPDRLGTLSRALARGSRLFRLQDLIASDQWLRGKVSSTDRITGYAQSWALFRMLMKKKPQAVRSYLKLIYDRCQPTFRLADFRKSFGTDLHQLQEHYNKYLAQIVQDFEGRR